MSARWIDVVDKMIVGAMALAAISLFFAVMDFRQSRTWLPAQAVVQETRLVCRLTKRRWYERTSHHVEVYCDDVASKGQRQAEGWKPSDRRLVELKVVFEDAHGQTVHASVVPWLSEAGGLRPSDHVSILYAPERSTDIELASKVGGQYPAALPISILGWAAALGLWLWRRSLKAKGQSTAAD